MTSEAQMIREGGTQVAWKLNPCKPPASLRSAISLQFRGLSWHGQGQLAVEEMACYSHGVSFHWILKYSWLKPLVLSLPLHLSVCFSSFSVHLPLFCFSCLPAFFSSIHFCLSLVSFLPQPESKEDHTLSSLLSCILSVVNEKALSCFPEWPLFRENTMGPSNIPIAHVPLHSRVILKFWPPGVSFQASAASILPLQTQQCCLLSLGWQCKPTLKGVHLIWQKRLYSYWVDAALRET